MDLTSLQTTRMYFQILTEISGLFDNAFLQYQSDI